MHTMANVFRGTDDNGLATHAVIFDSTDESEYSELQWRRDPDDANRFFVIAQPHDTDDAQRFVFTREEIQFSGVSVMTPQGRGDRRDLPSDIEDFLLKAGYAPIPKSGIEKSSW